MQSSSAFVFIKGKIKVTQTHIKKIPCGQFACMYYNGKPLNRGASIKKLVEFINKNGYIIDGDALQIVQIDITVTDIIEEESIEIQVPIKNS